jgi:ABC-2 type transport system ATP-binding protein
MNADHNVVVQVDGLHKSYGDVHALRGLDLQVKSGEILGFLGPNGAGKTTAIKIFSGFIAADKGSAKICSYDCYSESVEVQKILGYLPENNPIYPEMRVVDALKFVGAAHYLRGSALNDSIDRVVEKTQLHEVFYRQVATCSKGFRQRVGLAQALLNDPQVLLLDEPTSGLDPLQVYEMRKLITELGEQKTVIITSHVLSEVEAVASRVVMLNNGSKVIDKQMSDFEDEQLVAVQLVCNKQKLVSLCQKVSASVEHVEELLDINQCHAVVSSTVSSQQLVSQLAKAACESQIEVAMLNPQGNSLEHQFRSICNQ